MLRFDIETGQSSVRCHAKEAHSSAAPALKSISSKFVPVLSQSRCGLCKGSKTSSRRCQCCISSRGPGRSSSATASLSANTTLDPGGHSCPLRIKSAQHCLVTYTDSERKLFLQGYAENLRVVGLAVVSGTDKAPRTSLRLAIPSKGRMAEDTLSLLAVSLLPSSINPLEGQLRRAGALTGCVREQPLNAVALQDCQMKVYKPNPRQYTATIAQVSQPAIFMQSGAFHEFDASTRISEAGRITAVRLAAKGTQQR